MRIVFGFVLIFGVGLAGFAVYMAQDYIAAHQAELERERAARAQIVPTKEVYVASEQVRYGQQLKPEHVQLIRWPEDSIPEGTFFAGDLFPDGETEPRIVLRSMEINEPIMAVKVTAPGEDAGVASRLSRGMRAFAIKVDVTSGVSGFLRPGDRVDVYWTGNSGEREGRGEFTKLIEAGIRLIAVDQTADADNATATVARTVTVEVHPAQVAALAQAQATGRLSLALVGAEDETVAEGVEIDQRTLLGIEAPEERVEAPVEEVCTIRTRRGADVVEIPIPCTN